SGHFEGTRWNVENCGMTTAFENVDRAHVPPRLCEKPWERRHCPQPDETRRRVSRQGAARPRRCVASARDRTSQSRRCWRDGGGMRAIDVACAAAIGLCACAPTDQYGTASFGPCPT